MKVLQIQLEVSVAAEEVFSVKLPHIFLALGSKSSPFISVTKV